MTNTQRIVKEIVEDYYKIDITTNTRKRAYIEARAIYYKLLRDYTKYSLHAIGATMEKDHSTVLYFIRKAKDWLLYDKDFENDYKTLNNRLVKVKELNPDGFKTAETLEGFWESEYSKLDEQHKELQIRYSFLLGQLKIVKPDLEEQFQLTD